MNNVEELQATVDAFCRFGEGHARNHHRKLGGDTMCPDLRSYLGQRVTVIVDRPLGSRHPDHDIWYVVNYGYVPGTLAPDGEPIDAYLLGVYEPVREASGVVIGIVVRAGLRDVEDKLVVPEGRRYLAEQIEALVEFQERFFDSRVVALEAAPS